MGWWRRRRPGGRGDRGTMNAPRMHRGCTTDAPWVHHGCTMDAPCSSWTRTAAWSTCHPSAPSTETSAEGQVKWPGPGTGMSWWSLGTQVLPGAVHAQEKMMSTQDASCPIPPSHGCLELLQWLHSSCVVLRWGCLGAGLPATQTPSSMGKGPWSCSPMPGLGTPGGIPTHTPVPAAARPVPLKDSQ